VEFFQTSRRNYFNGRVKAVMMALLLIAAIFVSGFVWANSKIVIRVDGKQINASALAPDPKDVLSAVGVQLGPRDEYRVITNEAGKASIIEVYRAIPMTMTIGSNVEFVWSGKPTVGEVAASRGYDSRSYKTIPEASARPTTNMNIRILTLSDKVMEKELPIPFPIIRQPDPKMEKGLEAVEETGVPGKKKATLRQMFEDGKEAGYDIIAEQVLAEPKPELLRVGTRASNDPGRGTIRFKNRLEMEATAYTPFDDGQSGITFSGIPAKRGIVAVDPRVIPLGTRVYVPGYGVALAADTGGAIKGSKIDLCIEDYNEAMRFGRRKVEVYILAE
jgi:3D (Asp-Asp-Asp) domain-containing protein